MNTLNGYSKSTLTDMYALTAAGGHYPLLPSGYASSNAADLSHYWCRMLTCRVVHTNNDYDITLYVHSAYNNKRGFIHIRARLSTTLYVNLTQISGNLPLTAFRLYYKVSDDNPAEIQLWCDCGARWDVYNYKIISFTTRCSKETSFPGDLHVGYFSETQTLPDWEYITLTQLYTPIMKEGKSYSWYNFQQYDANDQIPSYYISDCAVINITSYQGWQPWIRAVDSNKGSWALGMLGTSVYLGYINKTNTSNDLTASWSFNSSGSTTFPGSVLPASTNSQNLGSEFRKWNYLYATNVNAAYVNATNLCLCKGIPTKPSVTENDGTIRYPELWEAIFGDTNNRNTIQIFKSGSTAIDIGERSKIGYQYTASMIFAGNDVYGYLSIPYHNSGKHLIYIGGGNKEGASGWCANLYHNAMSLIPDITNTYNIGSLNNKWNKVYATSFEGNATSATSATKLSSTSIAFTPADTALTPDDVYTLIDGTTIKRGSWSYSGNGYISNDITGVGTIDLAGTTVIQAANSGTQYTQLYLTPSTGSTTGCKTNEIFMYNNNGSSYSPSWTRVVTNRNYTDYCLPSSGGTMTGTITSQNIVPAATNTYNLGNSSFKWNNIYTTHISATNVYATNLNGALPDTSLTWKTRSNDLNCTNPSLISVASMSILSANRLQFARPAGIIIEYFQDGGTTWENYGCTDAEKINLVSGQSNIIKAGKGLSAKATANDKLRITIHATNAGIYTRARALLINASTNGSLVQGKDRILVDIETAPRGSENNFTVSHTGLIISGWTGWNQIPLNGVSFGGGTTQTYNTGAIRLTFYSDGAGSSQASGAHFDVRDLYLIGDTFWNIPSKMAKTGHLYDYNYLQDMILPKDLIPETHNGGQIGWRNRQWSVVCANYFYENGTLLSDKYLGKTAQAADSAKLGGSSKESFMITMIKPSGDINANLTATNYSYICRLGAAADHTNLPTNCQYGNLVHFAGTNYDTAFELLGSYSTDKLLFRRGNWKADGTGTINTNPWKQIAFISDIPTSLPNPNALTIQGNGITLTNGVYDGSAVKTVNITPANIGALALTGGMLTGAIDLTNSPNTEDGYKMGLTLLGSNSGGIHFNRVSSYGNDYGNAITWGYSNNDTTAAAGIYVKTGNSYGTKMYIATTNLFADGPKAALEIDQAGNITALRSKFIGNLTGNVTGNVSGSSGSCTGTSEYAKALVVTSAIGDFNTPVYINASGVPVACSYDVDSVKTTTSNTSNFYIAGSSSNSTTTGTLYKSANVKVQSGTAVYASGGFYESSDARLKNFGNDINIDLDKLVKIPKKYFTWKDDKNVTLQIGTSAQAVKELYPELVGEDENGVLSVAYDKLAIIALAAVDKLYELVKSLQANGKGN